MESKHGMLKRTAVAFTGDGEVSEPRPRRLSGRVTTASTRMPFSMSNTRTSLEISGVPKKMTRSVGPEGAGTSCAAMIPTSV